MRLLNVTLAIGLVIIITLSSIFYNRSSVVTFIANHYLSEHNSALTCLDFDINKNLNVVIKRLCVDSPYAEAALLDSFITWQLNSPPLTKISNTTTNTAADSATNNTSLAAISVINITEVNLRLKADVTVPINTVPIVSPEKSALELRELPALISAALNELSLLTTPVVVNVKHFSYQPFSSQPFTKKKNDVYQGRFTLNPQQLNFSLANHWQEEIFAVDIVNKSQTLTANISGDLAKLRAFFLQHKSAFPVVISSLLSDNTWSVSGKVDSQVNWRNQRLSLITQLSDFNFTGAYGDDAQAMIELASDFTWQTSLIDNLLAVNFADNKQTLKQGLRLSSANLPQLLNVQGVEPQLIQLITDNAINSLTIRPLGTLTFDFAKQIINSDGVALTSGHLSEPITLLLSDVVLNYNAQGLVVVLNPQQASFSLTGPVTVTQLQPYSKKPVTLKLMGDLKQYSDSWQLTLSQDSVVELAQLSLSSGSATARPQINELNTRQPLKNNRQPSIKSLLSYWQGSIVINKNQQQINNKGVIFALAIDNQIKQLTYPEVIKINNITLKAIVKGGIDNLTINTQLIADNVPIATAQVSGDINQPTISISAEQLALTDILALNLKLPIKLALIDGTLDYQLTGQLKKSKNIEDLMTNPLSLALSVQNLSGDVAGTWLQDLNWQQHFTLQNGQLKSITANAKPPSNLSVAKIETITEINHLAATTVIDVSPETITLQLKNIGASLLEGRFDIDLLQWPLTNTQPINVKLTTIDLEKLLELDKNQGIVVTGKVSGDLPVFYDGEHLLIKAGYLYNVGDGLIQVYNNAAVEELKSSAIEVKLAFDALENLHYHQLSSAVSMADDGYMLLTTVIKGRNPDLDNEVNLNLNLSYDLIGLLESFNITERFENTLLQDAKN